jgi:hypothetical protein
MGATWMESEVPLRKLILPQEVMSLFFDIALPNTNTGRDGIETCGLLAGKLVHNNFVVTDLVIPVQTGTSDTCGKSKLHQMYVSCHFL